MKRSQIRELAFKLMYSKEIQKEIDEEQIEIFLEQNDINESKDIEYIKTVYNGINQNSEEIINLI